MDKNLRLCPGMSISCMTSCNHTFQSQRWTISLYISYLHIFLHMMDKICCPYLRIVLEFLFLFIIIYKYVYYFYLSVNLSFYIKQLILNNLPELFTFARLSIWSISFSVWLNSQRDPQISGTRHATWQWNQMICKYWN